MLFFFFTCCPLAIILCTVKSLLIRTPRSYGHFALSTGKESPYICSKINPLNTDSPLIRTLSIAPTVSLLTEFDGTESFVSSLRKNRRDNDSLWLMSLQHRKARATSSCCRHVLCLSFSVGVSFLKLVSPQSLCTAAPSPPPLKIGEKNSLPNFVWGEGAAVRRLLATLSLPFAYIRRFGNEKGNAVEMPPAIFWGGSLQGTRRSAIGQMLTVPEVSAKVTSAQFPSRF